MKTNEIQREGRKKDRLERDLRQANADLDTKVVEIKNLQQNLEQSTNNVAKLNGDLKDQKVRGSVIVLLIFNNGYLLWNRSNFHFSFMQICSPAGTRYIFYD